MYCTACNTSVMATIRMCPKCGNRTFSETPSTAPAVTRSGAGTTNQPTASAVIASHSLAGRGARLGASILDTIIFCACFIPGIFVLSSSNSEATKGFGSALLLIGWLGFLIVQAIFLTKRGQSLGKMIVGIKIVNFSNESLPGFAKVFVLRMFVPGLLSGIPYLGWLFWLVDGLFIFRDDQRCVHDLIAQTKVVNI